LELSANPSYVCFAATEKEAPEGEGTMSRSNYRKLLDNGRKAGLNTSELYRALASRPPEAQDNSNQVADGNGFVSYYLQGGQRVYRPIRGTSGA
jgi:hypothetical protein